MTEQVRVGVIAGVAQIVVAVVALVGTLITSSGSSTGTQAASATSPSSEGGTSCTAVIERYRELVLADSSLVTVLTTPGPDGLAPIEADPDARRCGLSAEALQAMR